MAANANTINSELKPQLKLCFDFLSILTLILGLTGCNLANSIHGNLGYYNPSLKEKIEITNAPFQTSVDGSLNMSIGFGSNFTHYRYKLGISAAEDCTLSAGYSDELPVTTPITDDISSYADGGLMKVCVVGKMSDGVYQDFTDANSVTWYKESNPIEIEFADVGQSFTDANSSQTITVQLSETKPYDVIFPIEVQGGTLGLDFNLASTSVTIPAGQSSANFGLDILRNPSINPELDLRIHLTPGGFGQAIRLGERSSQFSSIRDVDGVTNSNVVKVIIRGNNSCAIRSDGGLYCWGQNDLGQIGDGTTVDKDRPTFVGNDYVHVDSGFGQSCGLKSDNTLYCWGSNFSGAVGDGTTTHKTSPTLIGTDFSQTIVTGSSSCGLKLDNTLYCWGKNDFGQLGDGTTVNKTIPTLIGSDFAQVKKSTEYSCGIKLDNSLYCWGKNDKGQLGDGTTVDKTSPTLIDTGFAQIETGTGSTCGIKLDNSLYCWGNNGNGRLGDGTTVDKTTPTLIGTNFAKVSWINNSFCALKLDGGVYCWGENFHGQIGDGTTVDKSTPVLVGTGYEQLESPRTAFVCGIKTGGALYCWAHVTKPSATTNMTS
jgi:alpha-tubulin suppressor-like RCC1 family protein